MTERDGVGEREGETEAESGWERHGDRDRARGEGVEAPTARAAVVRQHSPLSSVEFRIATGSWEIDELTIVWVKSDPKVTSATFPQS